MSKKFIIICMEAKVIYKTKVNRKEMVSGYFLGSQSITLFYGILFAVYVITLGHQLLSSNPTADTAELILYAVIIASTVVGMVFPIVKSYIWESKLKKQYGVDEEEIEVYFTDIGCKWISVTRNEEVKIDFRKIIKKQITKKQIYIGYDPKNFVILSKDKFAKPTDFDKVSSYISRFTKK